MNRLGVDFFDRPCETVAKSLLGKLLVREMKLGNDKEIFAGKIVEVEAYLGVEDKAAHSYQGRRTDRNEAMFMEPGTAYVYNIYGMYQCVNISTGGEGAAVLLRAACPLLNVEAIQKLRLNSSRKRSSNASIKMVDLCNGPSKLCQAFGITKQKFNKVNLCKSNELYFAESITPDESFEILSSPRIGIDYAEEWSQKPLRFYVKESPFVSRVKKFKVSH
ncbi:DNA-3-methyladenine glycosylase [Trichinella spiralis]|uniref:DNA-3-methyladenine glycosylase II n=1 Tax=Trichinella spiralis TaxID=6334 RepID=A0ABR3K2Z5_TRISP